MNINLLHDFSSIRSSKFGSITGQIFFKFEENFFFWLQVLLDLLKNNVGISKLDFMDGPFSMKLELQESDQVKIQCLNDDKNVILYQTTENVKEFSVLISDFSSEILHFCEKKGWSGKDLDNLEKNNAEVSKLCCQSNNKLPRHPSQ